MLSHYMEDFILLECIRTPDGLGGSTTHLEGFGDVRAAGHVAGAALQGGKLNGTYLGVQIGSHLVAQVTGSTGQVLVAKGVHKAGVVL